jgi:hypothetical protein
MQKLEINSLPKSLAEARVVGHNLYYTGKECKHGHLTYRYVKDRACSDCIKLKVKKLATVGGGNARRWANRTPEQLAIIYEKRKKYYAETKSTRQENQRTFYLNAKENPQWMDHKRKKTNERRKIYGRGKEVSNPDVKKRYKQTPKGKANTLANDAKRRAAKLQRTPPWLDIVQNAEIEFTYEYCAALRSIGLNYHVDHIVPLQGKTVSGLHVPWNLQVIPADENIRKANRFET